MLNCLRPIIAIVLIVFSFNSGAIENSNITIMSEIDESGDLKLSFKDPHKVNFDYSEAGNSIMFKFNSAKNIYFIDQINKNSFVLSANNRFMASENNQFIDNINLSSDGMELLINFKYAKFVSKKQKHKILFADFANPLPKSDFSKFELVAQNEEVRKFSEIVKFPWSIDVGAVSFLRHNKLYIIFNRPKRINGTSIEKASSVIKEVEQINNNSSTILKLTLDIDFLKKNNIVSKFSKKNQSWYLLFDQIIKPTKTIVKEFKSEYSKGMFFPAPKSEKIIKFLDKDVGDEIQVIPFLRDEIRTVNERDMIDFKVFETLQGFAISIKNEDTELLRIRQGIEILSPNFSRKIYEKKPEAEMEEEIPETFKINPYAKSLLPFKEFKKINKNNFIKDKKKFRQNFLQAKDSERLNALKDYIKFYFVHGLHVETMGLIDLNRPALKNDPAFDLMLAISHFKNGDNVKALKEISSVSQELDELEAKEIDFWKQVLQWSSGKPDAKINFVSNMQEFVNTYPPEMQVDLGLMEVDEKIEHKKFKSARNLIELLKLSKPSKFGKNSLKFYDALILQNEKKFDDAEDFFEEIQNDALDRKNRMRAGLESVKQKLNLKQITVPEAIDELNKLRFVWRRDKNEANLLKVLAGLYYEQKNYIEALRVWKEIVSNISQGAEMLLITSKMGQVFSEVILNSTKPGSNLKDFQVAALYYEFKELTPIGVMGDKIVRILADKLFNLDLLEQTAEILEHQLAFRTEKEKKIDTANKLALVYILNNEPQNALNALKKTDGENFNYENYTEKLFLKSHALVNLGKYDEALKLLKGLKEPEVLEIKVKAAIAQNSYEEVKTALEPHLTAKGKELGQLSDIDSNYVVQLGIAYVLTGEIDNFERLYNVFHKNISEKKGLKESLEFLYERREFIDPVDLENSIGLEKIESFLKLTKERMFN